MNYSELTGVDLAKAMYEARMVAHGNDPTYPGWRWGDMSDYGRSNWVKYSTSEVGKNEFLNNLAKLDGKLEVIPPKTYRVINKRKEECKSNSA